MLCLLLALNCLFSNCVSSASVSFDVCYRRLPSTTESNPRWCIYPDLSDRYQSKARGLTAKISKVLSGTANSLSASAASSRLKFKGRWHDSQWHHVLLTFLFLMLRYIFLLCLLCFLITIMMLPTVSVSQTENKSVSFSDQMDQSSKERGLRGSSVLLLQFNALLSPVTVLLYRFCTSSVGCSFPFLCVLLFPWYTRCM